MSFTTKTAFDFCGALDALVDYATGTVVEGESLGTPDSSETGFSGTLSNTSVHRYGAAVIHGTTVSPASADDDFATLNTTRWTVDNGTDGSSSAAGDLALAIAATGSADSVVLSSNFRVLDDCEISFDFSSLSGLADDADGVGLRFSVDADNYVECYAGVYDGAKFFGQSNFSDNLSSIVASARTSAYGGLKLKRINTVVEFYGKDGAGSYTLVGSFPLRNGREVTVDIELHRAIDSGVSVTVDDFVVTKGHDLWANQYVAYADADGVITGTGVTAGSVAKDGTWSLEFDAAPATGTTLVMNYKEYVTDPDRGDWEVRLWDNARNISNVETTHGDETRACVLKSTGISGVEEILIGIREWKNTSTSKWGWALNVYHSDPLTLWHVNLDGFGMGTYDTSNQCFSKLPTAPFSDSILPMWLYANKQRIFMVARCSDSSYTSAYTGFAYRLDPPSSYPRPNMAIGERGDVYDYLYASNRYSVHRGYNSSSLGTYMLLRSTSGVYKYNELFMAPQQGDINIQPVASTYDGLLMTWPVYVKEEANDVLLTQLDGIFVARGQSLTAESTFVQGSKTYRIFYGGANGGVYNFYAVEEV